MSSLVPGSLFYTTGLNRKHTPTPATITNDELSERYARAAFNGRPWPPTSPVSGVYDISNSSTSLILLNNRKRKESQLRGRSNPRKEEHRYPEPERHSRCSTPVNKDYHTRCIDSSSPYYEPEFDVGMDWLNRSQRPANRFAAGSAVNPKRHTSCQVPSNPRAFDVRLHSPRRPTSRTSLPANFGKSQGYRELTPGEQRYFASISKVYLNTHMVRLKRRQYIDLLNQELSKGLYTKAEYERYRDYIALGRQRQYLNISNRATSAPVRRSTYSDTDTDKSFTSYNDEEKSYMSEMEAKKSDEKSPQNKRATSPDRQRPPSTTSSRRSVTRSSQDKSRSSSAKSTMSAKSGSGSNKSEVSVKSAASKSSKKYDNREDTKQKLDKKQTEDDHANAEQEEKSTKKESVENENEKSDTISYDKVEQTESAKKREETSDSDTGLPSDKQYSAREGHDRPKSRLGHIPEDSTTPNTAEGQDEETKLDQEIKKEFGEEEKDKENIKTTTQDKEKSENNSEQKYKSKKHSSDSDSDSDAEQIKDPDKLPY